jgi:hypothetical protein
VGSAGHKYREKSNQGVPEPHLLSSKISCYFFLALTVLLSRKVDLGCQFYKTQQLLKCSDVMWFVMRHVFNNPSNKLQRSFVICVHSTVKLESK